MSLFFEDAKVRKRKYQCFVCGRQYTDLEEYNKHILEKHEEGREFIKCPGCGYAVRDLRQHWKAKHPKRVMPKNCQMKVAVWRDFTGGKKKSRKLSFKEGYLVSNKMGGTEMHYRSSYEEKVYECLEALNDVMAYYVEPFKIPYFYDGKWRKYIPDIRLDFVDGHTEIWEIKPASQTTLKQNECKWTAMNEHATSLGWIFEVKTEIGIEKLQKRVKDQASQSS